MLHHMQGCLKFILPLRELIYDIYVHSYRHLLTTIEKLNHFQDSSTCKRQLKKIFHQILQDKSSLVLDPLNSLQQ